MSEPLDPIFVVDFSCFSFLSQPHRARSRDLIDFAGWHQQKGWNVQHKNGMDVIYYLSAVREKLRERGMERSQTVRMILEN